MQECDPLSFRSNPRSRIDQLHSRGTAAIQHPVQIIHREADVMNPGAATREEFSYRSIRSRGLEQLDETLPGRDSRDAGAVGIGQLHRRHSQHVAEKRELRGNGFQRDAYMGDPGAVQGFFLH